MEVQDLLVRVVGGVQIFQDGKYLLVQEGQPKAYGLWNWPAGRVEVGSTVQETAVREAKEEAGVDVRITGKIGVWHDEQAVHPVTHLYSAEIVGGEIRPAEGEILAVSWFTKDEIVAMKDKLRALWIIESLQNETGE